MILKCKFQQYLHFQNDRFGHGAKISYPKLGFLHLYLCLCVTKDSLKPCLVVKDIVSYLKSFECFAKWRVYNICISCDFGIFLTKYGIRLLNGRATSKPGPSNLKNMPRIRSMLLIGV